MKHYFNKNNKILRKITKFAKIFKIDFSFFILFIFAFLLEEIKLYLCMFVFVILHEMVHFFVAKKLGYLPQKIRLNFFGASLEGYDDFSLYDEIKIVLAGPIFNFLVVIFCYLCFWFYPESYDFLYEILVANWSLFLFNFLPIFPLDFGRFLLAVFSTKRNRIEAVKTVKKISVSFLFFMFFIFLMSVFYGFNFSLGFVCVNLTVLVFSSAKDTSYKRQLFVCRKLELLKKGLIERRICVNENILSFKLFKFIDDYHFVQFVFLNEHMEIVRIVSEFEFYKENKLLPLYI